MTRSDAWKILEIHKKSQIFTVSNNFLLPDLKKYVLVQALTQWQTGDDLFLHIAPNTLPEPESGLVIEALKVLKMGVK